MNRSSELFQKCCCRNAELRNCSNILQLRETLFVRHRRNEEGRLLFLFFFSPFFLSLEKVKTKAAASSVKGTSYVRGVYMVYRSSVGGKLQEKRKGRERWSFETVTKWTFGHSVRVFSAGIFEDTWVSRCCHRDAGTSLPFFHGGKSNHGVCTQPCRGRIHLLCTYTPTYSSPFF